MRTNQFLRRWLPLLLWMAAIYYFSAQPSSSLPNVGKWDWVIKKGAHFTAYAILALLAFRVCEGWKRPFLTAFLFVLLYAVSDEYHQTFVVGRNGTWVDVLIDAAGAFSGLVMLMRVKSRQKRWQPASSMSDQP